MCQNVQDRCTEYLPNRSLRGLRGNFIPVNFVVWVKNSNREKTERLKEGEEGKWGSCLAAKCSVVSTVHKTFIPLLQFIICTSCCGVRINKLCTLQLFCQRTQADDNNSTRFLSRLEFMVLSVQKTKLLNLTNHRKRKYRRGPIRSWRTNTQLVFSAGKKSATSTKCAKKKFICNQFYAQENIIYGTSAKRGRTCNHNATRAKRGKTSSPRQERKTLQSFFSAGKRFGSWLVVQTASILWLANAQHAIFLTNDRSQTTQKKSETWFQTKSRYKTILFYGTGVRL